MNHWLEADPEDILDEVILARQLAGEDLDETSQRTRAMIRNDITSSQRQIAASVVQSGAGIAVFRSMTLKPEEIDGFEVRGLGECWAFDRRGAFAYDGRRSDIEIVVEAEVSADDVVWPMVVGMWSSGEGEARLDSGASVTIKEIRSRSGDPLREDLWGVEHPLRPTRPVATP